MTPYWHHKAHMEQKNSSTTHTQPLAMAPIPKRRKKSPVILAAPAPIPLAAVPAPVSLIAVPTPVPLPAAPAPIPVVVVMAPPPTPVPLIPAVAGRAPPQVRAPTQAEGTDLIHPLGILVEIIGTDNGHCRVCPGRHSPVEAYVGIKQAF